MKPLGNGKERSIGGMVGVEAVAAYKMLMKSRKEPASLSQASRFSVCGVVEVVGVGALREFWTCLFPSGGLSAQAISVELGLASVNCFGVDMTRWL